MEHWSQPGRLDLDGHDCDCLDQLGELARFVRVLHVSENTRSQRRWQARQKRRGEIPAWAALRRSRPAKPTAQDVFQVLDHHRVGSDASWSLR